MTSFTRIAKVAVVASLYATLVVVLAPISFAAVQVRVADALLLLPFLDFFGFSAVVGLTIGCALANLVSPFGVYDVVFGSLANFAAGTVAWVIGKVSKSTTALVVAAVLQALVVTFIIGYVLLHLVYGLELLVSLGGVLLGSIISTCALGIPIVSFMVKRLKLR